ncbi:hypothetical protein [Bacillus sp. AFS017336]|uniref:hypothetical protein n=1 Tax=Bacillus sp. AFS017336 TaxID=2033489 RepID=UPI000BF1A020|nr:hypothetical protein [Bacillus sp. AFS017336]PEL09903.1 hypothetical protein CN601_15295 [Bacillus sp. AFS017336]
MNIKAIKLSICTMLIFVSMFLLTACVGAGTIDVKAQKYIKDKYGFEVDVLEKPNINEGNMGDTYFKVRKRTGNKLTFNIYIKGMLFTKIIGDDYDIQSKTFEMKKAFEKSNSEILSRAKVKSIEFKSENDMESFDYADTGNVIQHLKVNVVSANVKNLFDTEKMNSIYEVLKKFQEFSDVYKPLDVKEISMSYTNDINKRITFDIDNVHSIYSMSDFERESSTPYEPPNITNFAQYSYYIEESALFKDFEGGLRSLGYDYLNTNQMPVFNQDLDLAFESDEYSIFDIQLKGNIDDVDQVYQLLQFLTSAKLEVYNVRIFSLDNKYPEDYMNLISFHIPDGVSKEIVKQAFKEREEYIKELD